MKKIVALILSFTMILSFASIAYASSKSYEAGFEMTGGVNVNQQITGASSIKVSTSCSCKYGSSTAGLIVVLLFDAEHTRL